MLFRSFANTIAISEKEGWYADTTGIAERAYIYQTVASHVIKLWLQEQMTVANVQGADMLQIALRSEERRVGKECRSRWSPYH